MARWSAAIAALTLALSLAACGGGASPDLSGVARAAQKTEGAGTARFELAFETSGLSQTGGEASFTADGAVDYDRQLTRMTMDLSSFGGLLGGSDAGDFTFDAVLDGTVFYMRFPLLAGLVGEGKPWLKMDLEKVAKLSGNDLGLGMLGQSDPAQALAYLRAAGDFDELGKEDVRGVATTHYKGIIDPREALDQLSGPQKEQLEKQLDESGVGEIPAEAWIDGDGYLRRLTVSLAVAGQTIASTTEFFDFGEDVDIQVPGDDEVTDFSELTAKEIPTG